MASRRTSMLIETPVVGVYDVVCRARASRYGPSEASAQPQLVLPRTGTFLLERRGQKVAIDTNTALLLGADEEYRVSHPRSEGDDCTVVVVPPEVLDEALGGVDGRDGPFASRARLAFSAMMGAFRYARADRLEVEETTLLLLKAISEGWSAVPREPVHGTRTSPEVEEVRLLLASSPSERWDLRTIAQAVHASPFHLCRRFRAVTGETMSRYLLRLRLGLALARLADGERDLASLALALGFAHHSHFSARFREVFGVTPSSARRLLTEPGLGRLRRLLGGTLSV